MRLATPVLASAFALAAFVAGASPFQDVEGATFRSVLPVTKQSNLATVAPFRLQAMPVTNAEYLAFVQAHPQWQRSRIPELYADRAYLSQWAGDLVPGPNARPKQPVVNVSWFAADAYCESIGARLPTWNEWEWAASADGKRADAREDPSFRQQILDWYATSGGRPLAEVGARQADLRGIHDLHGLVWEWVDDFGAMMVAGDSREQGDPDLLKFCGTGALTMEQKENYAVLMRIAMLSSLQASYTTATLGFRCAQDGAR